jgi:hypothetical protein
MIKKIVAGATAVGATLAAAGSAFAADPTPTPIAMDPGVQATITNLLSSYVLVAFALLAVAVGIVGVLWISMRGIGLLFKYFHWFGH